MLPMSSLRRRAASLLAVLVIAASVVAPTAPARGAQSDLDPQLAAVLPEWHDELGAAIDDVSARYTIDAEAELREPSVPGGAPEPVITATLAMAFTNTTGEALPDIPFRLYANDIPAGHEPITVADVTVDGAAVEAARNADGSTVRVPLPAPLAAGESVEIALGFVTVVPVDEVEHYGIFNFDPDAGTWALAHWYPVLAGYDPERGFVLDPPSTNGDPIFSTTATYEVTLRTPLDWRAVTTGVEIERTDSGDISERRYVSGPARDFTMVLDDDFAVAEREVGGTVISAWYNPGQERSGEATAEYAAQAVRFASELIGPYPYATLDIVPVELFGAAGVEFPQLFYMSSGYYGPGQDLSIPNFFDFTIAHEVLHMWWYDIVGNNQYDHAWIDEGLTNYISAVLYHDEIYGPEVGEIMLEQVLRQPFDSTVATGGDQIVDTPTDDFPTGGGYAWAAYTKAPLGFMAIHDAIGDDAFSAALGQYYADFRFRVATPEDLLAAFEAASGQDLGDLWTAWFEQAIGDPADDPTATPGA